MKSKERFFAIWGILKGYRGTLLNAFISSILVTFLGMNWPMVYRYIINKVFYEAEMEQLKFIFVIYITLFVAEKLLQYIWKLSEGILASDFIYDLEKKIYKKMYLMKLSEKEKYSSGEILDILNNDTQQLYRFLVDEGVFAVTCFVRLILALSYTFFISRVAAVYVFALVLINYAISKKLKRRVMKYFSQYKNKLEEYNHLVIDILTGLREIKLFNAGNSFRNKFKKKTLELFNLYESELNEETNKDNINIIANSISELVLYIIAAFVIFYKKIMLGDFISLMIYYEWIKIFFGVFMQLFTNASKSFMSLDRIIDFFKCEEENCEGDRFINGDISFENVSFAYKNRFVIKEVNLKIEQGKIVALAGVSGSGKTTLIKLLLKFYCVKEGNISIGGKNIFNISATEIREKIGIVNQNSRLFECSIRENLLLGKRDASESEMWSALKVAQALEFVERLPEKLDTEISSMENLSTGQIQRIILARVLLKNPEILIFDEATSNLDESTEEEFLKEIKENVKGKTIIIIAYRKASLSLAEFVYFIKDGEICDSGTNEELILRCEEYRNLSMTGEYCNECE